MPCLSSGLPYVKPSVPLSTRNQVEPPGSVGQDRVPVGDAAVADPLLAAGDPVADDLAVLLDRDGRGRERPEVAAGLRLGRAVGVEVAVLGQRPEPIGLLLGGRPDVDRVGAEEGGEDAGGDPEVDRGHGLGHPVDVVGPPAESAELLRDGQQVQADLPRVVEVLHDLLGEVVAELDLQEPGDGEVLLRVLLERRQYLVQHLGVESRHEAPCVLSGTRRGLAKWRRDDRVLEKLRTERSAPNPTETTPRTESCRYLRGGSSFVASPSPEAAGAAGPGIPTVWLSL